MSNEERGDGTIEQYSSGNIGTTDDRSRSDRPTRRSSTLSDTTVIDAGTDSSIAEDATSSDSLADVVSGSLSRSASVTAETASASATLVGVPRVDIQEFVFSHKSNGCDERCVALFDVQNTSESPLRWKSNKTQFIGTDQYTYSPSRTSLDPESLGPGCHTRQVELPPGKRARVVTLVEELPHGVDVSEVVQTLSAGVGTAGNERLVFSL
jgi:hypothetical protein